MRVRAAGRIMDDVERAGDDGIDEELPSARSVLARLLIALAITIPIAAFVIPATALALVLVLVTLTAPFGHIISFSWVSSALPGLLHIGALAGCWLAVLGLGAFVWRRTHPDRP